MRGRAVKQKRIRAARLPTVADAPALDVVAGQRVVASSYVTGVTLPVNGGFTIA